MTSISIPQDRKQDTADSTSQVEHSTIRESPQPQPNKPGNTPVVLGGNDTPPNDNVTSTEAPDLPHAVPGSFAAVVETATSPETPDIPHDVSSAFAAVVETVGSTTNAVLATAQQAIHTTSETAKQCLPAMAISIPGFQPSDPNAKEGLGVRETSSPQDLGQHNGTPKLASGVKPYMNTLTTDLPDRKSLPETPTGSPIAGGSLPARKSEASVPNPSEGRTKHETADESGGLPGTPNKSGVALARKERTHSKDKTLTNTGVQTAPAVVVLATTVLTEATHDRPQPHTIDSTSNEKRRLRTIPGTREELPDAELQALIPPSTATHLESKQYLCHTTPETIPGTREEVLEPEMAAKRNPEVRARAPSPPKSEEAAVVAPTTQGSSIATSSTTAPPAVDRRTKTGSASAPRHKVKFVDKLKGEAMVISGKLRRNVKKIEEGRQLMGK